MARFASGKDAWGYSDRSGFRYRLREMVTEWNGLKVGPDEYETKHPQLQPVRVGPDPQALHNPRPPSIIHSVSITFPTFNSRTLEVSPVAVMHGFVGDVVTTGTTPSGTVTVSITGVSATGGVNSVSVGIVTNYTVTVASGTNSYGTGNKYYVAGLSGASPTLTLSEGSTYRFDQSDNSNSGHPFRFSETANGTHAGGSEYTTGVSTNGSPGSSGAYTQITVASGTPTLYYYCTNHSGMGGTANTP